MTAKTGLNPDTSAPAPSVSATRVTKNMYSKLENSIGIRAKDITHKIMKLAEEPSMAQLLDSSVDEAWLSKDRREERMRSGRERLRRQEGGSVRPKSRFTGHPWPLDVKLPLPAKEVLDAMESEVRGLLQEAPLGPIAKQ